MTIEADNQKLDGENFVELFQLDTTLISSSGAVYYFTNKMNEETYIAFGGNTYIAIDCEAKGFEYDGKGAFPRPRLLISNVNNLLTALVIELGDLRGAKFTRIRTYEKYLDGKPGADSGAYMPLDIFFVEQKLTQNKVYIEFVLKSVLDVTGVSLPGRLAMRDNCTNTYRFYQSGAFVTDDALCPYVGSNYFDENDDPTTNPSKDNCSRRLSGCKARYGATKILPFAGFPGIGRE